MVIAYYAPVRTRCRTAPGRSVALCLLLAAYAKPQTDWPMYGHDPGGQAYSQLKQIHTGNVSKLQVAWTYDIRPKPAGSDSAPVPRSRASQSTPLVVGNVMYLSTPYSRVLALAAETGKKLWEYQCPYTPAGRGIV